MVGSGRKMSSYEPDVDGCAPVVAGSADVPSAFVCERAFAQSDFSETARVGSALLGTNPSCKHLRHQDSKSRATSPRNVDWTGNSGLIALLNSRSRWSRQ